MLRKLVWSLVKDSVDRDMETLSAEYAESISRLLRAQGKATP